MTTKKIFQLLIVLLALSLFSTILSGCSSAADTASINLSKDADNFKIERRIVFYNGITDKYIFVVEGLCSLGNNDPAGEVSVTCKVGADEYLKHFLGLSDNVTYFAEQLKAVPTDIYHYKVFFRPEEIVPSIELQTSGQNK